MIRPLASLTLAAIALAGCAASSDGETTPPDAGFASTLERAIKDADAANASDSQQATLQKWRATGETPYSDVAEALDRTFACFEAAGLVYSYSPPAAQGDFPEIEYTVTAANGLSDDEAIVLINECETRELFYVSLAYQLGPGVNARRDREDAERFPAAIECVEDHGVTVPADVTTLTQLSRYLIETGATTAEQCTDEPAP